MPCTTPSITESLSVVRRSYFTTNNGNSFAKTEIELTLNGKSYAIKLHDTAGHEEFEKVRQVFYKTVSMSP